jgi:hypothetical protein
MLLDEIDRIGRLHSSYTVEFFENLRALANSGQLVIVTAGKMPLAHAITQISPTTSEFFNLFQQRKIGLLAPATEALRFIHERGLPLGFSEASCEKLASLAGPHPLRLQIVGSLWWEVLSQNSGLPTSLEPTPAHLENLTASYREVCSNFGLKDFAT